MYTIPFSQYQRKDLHQIFSGNKSTMKAEVQQHVDFMFLRQVFNCGRFLRIMRSLTQL